MSKRLEVAALGLLLGFSVAPIAACGGAVDQARVSSPFTEEHAKFFEDGLSLVGDPTSLGGGWRDEWEADLDRRIELSDLIARVTVDTVRSSQQRDRVMLQLELVIQERLLGPSPAPSLAVSVYEGEPGYPSVLASEGRVLHAEFILFVKWYQDQVGHLVPHWHLAPDTAVLRAIVTDRVELMGKSTTSATSAH